MLIAGLIVGSVLVEVATVWFFSQLLKRERNDALRRERYFLAQNTDLVDRAMYLVNRPWVPAPVDVAPDLHARAIDEEWARDPDIILHPEDVPLITEPV